MASTAHRKKSEIRELFDKEDDIVKKVNKLADLIKSSKYAVIYTGAGISTSAGIPDFRGPNGVWTLEDRGLKTKSLHHVEMPTLTHMAIKQLIDADLVKYLVSQNVDGLHIKSGIPNNKIAELHGNTNKEICPKCKKIYDRDFYTVLDDNSDDDHRTGRRCDECESELVDTIVNFGEYLPKEELCNAEKESKKCDLAIVLGTSMRVPPACDLPSMRKCDGKLVICNLQITDFDDEAQILIHGKTDQIMSLLMQRLSIPIPEYIHEIQFRVSISENMRSLTIFDSSVNFREMFNSFLIIDSNMNEIKLRSQKYSGGRIVKGKLNSYSNQDELIMRFEVNILHPIKSEIQIIPPCRVIIKINTSRSTLSHVVNKD